MPLPNTTFRSELPPVVRKEFDQSNADTAGYLVTEHDEDGHHTNITAKSLTIKGPVAITGGPLTINGAPVTPGGGSTVAPHHVTHEPGGTDALVNAAWTHQANAFTQPTQFLANVDVATNLNITGTGGVFTPVVILLDASTGVWLRSGIGRLQALSNTNAYVDLGARDLFEKGRTAALGHWIDVPFSAANFTASAGSWIVAAGNVSLNRYTLIGKTLIWTLYVSGSTLTANPAELYITVPPGMTLRPFGSTAPAQLFDTAFRPGSIYVGPAGSFVYVLQNPYAFYAATTNMIVMFTLAVEIN